MRRLLGLAAALFVVGAALVLPARSNLVVAPWGGGGGGGGTSGTCAPSIAALSRLNTAAAINTTYQTAYDNFICGLNTAGIWTKFDAVWVMATQAQANAILNLVSSSFTLTLNGSPNFLAHEGFLGVEGSTTVFINTNFNTSSSGTNLLFDRGNFGVWVISPNAQSAGAVIGNHAALERTSINTRFTDNVMYGSFFQSNAITNTTIINSTGSWSVNRPNSTTTEIYRNGALVVSDNVTSNAGTPPNLNMYILSQNDNGAVLGSGYRVGMAWIGGPLTAGQIASARTIGCAYMTAIGSTAAC